MAKSRKFQRLRDFKESISTFLQITANENLENSAVLGYDVISFSVFVKNEKERKMCL